MANGSDKNMPQPSRRPTFNWRILAMALASLVFFAFLTNTMGESSTRQISYSQFKQAVQEGRVASVTLHGQALYGQFAAAAVGATQNSGQTQGQTQGAASSSESGQDAAASSQGAAAEKSSVPDFTTTRPKLEGMQLMSLLEKNNVDINVSYAHFWCMGTDIEAAYPVG